MKNILQGISIWFFLAVFAFLSSGCASQPDGIEALAERVLGDASRNFVFSEITPAEGEKDVFEIISEGSRIRISGNNGVAQASGLNYYLENFCGVQVSVNDFDLELPEVLPSVDMKIRKETEYDYRYIFNYCTYGYTMPWWDWEKWERMIDYMAMKGINMPLSIIGQESVWKEVYKELYPEAKITQINDWAGVKGTQFFLAGRTGRGVLLRRS